jgi:hypothetical protein
VSEGIGVPERSVKFEGSFIGGPSFGCAGLFSTPKGACECSLSAYTTDGGKNFFVAPPGSLLSREDKPVQNGEVIKGFRKLLHHRHTLPICPALYKHAQIFDDLYKTVIESSR